MHQSQEMHLLFGAEIVFGAEIAKICTEFHSAKNAWSAAQMKNYSFCQKLHYSSELYLMTTACIS